MLLSSAAAFSDCKQCSNPFLKQGMRYFSARKDGLPFTYTTLDIASFRSHVPCDKLSGLKCLSLESYIQPLESDNIWSLPSLETLTCLSLPILRNFSSHLLLLIATSLSTMFYPLA